VATRNNRPFSEGDPDLGDRRRSQRGSPSRHVPQVRVR
jgi:hypothetical protein